MIRGHWLMDSSHYTPTGRQGMEEFVRQARRSMQDAQEWAAEHSRETERLLARDKALGRGRATAARDTLPPSVVVEITAPWLGKRYQRDAFACARGLGLQVEMVPADVLQDPARPNFMIDGRLVVPLRLIQLADHLRGPDLHRTLCHEIGHHVLGSDASELSCGRFADFFLRAPLPETPAQKWRRWQREREEKARAAARAR